MDASVSRLDRLFGLLSAGSPAARAHAAHSLAQAVHDRPTCLEALLAKLETTCLLHRDWTTRQAGARALREMLGAVRADVGEGTSLPSLPTPTSSTPLRVDSLLSCAPLASSAQLSRCSSNDSLNEDTITSRRNVDKELQVNKTLIGIGSADLGVSDEDLKNQSRLIRRSCKSDAHEHVEQNSRIRNEHLQLIQSVLDLSICEHYTLHTIITFACRLCLFLYSPHWELRHGAVLGLQEVVSFASVRQLLASIVVRECLTVLLLDRFYDFFGSYARAPVRETCAAVLVAVQVDQPNELGLFLQLINNHLMQDAIDWDHRWSALLVLQCVFNTTISSYEMPPQLCDGADRFMLSCLSQEQNDELSHAAGKVLLAAGFNEALFPCTSAAVVSICVSAVSRVEQHPDVLTYLQLMSRFVPTATHATDGFVLSLFRLCENIHSDIRKQSLTVLNALPFAGLADSSAAQSYFRIVFQRCLLESDNECVALIETLWSKLLHDSLSAVFLDAFCPLIGPFLVYLMSPNDNPKLDPLFLYTEHGGISPENAFISGKEQVFSVKDRERVELVLESKQIAVNLLAQACDKVFQLASDDETVVDCFSTLVCTHLTSDSALQKCAVSMLLGRMKRHVALQRCKSTLLDVLVHPVKVYEETGLLLKQLSDMCNDYVSFLLDLDVQPPTANGTIADTTAVSTVAAAKLFEHEPLVSDERTKKIISEKFAILKPQVNYTLESLRYTSLSVLVWQAYAAVRMQCLPEKLNPLIVPLMDAVKYERGVLTKTATEGLCTLISLCASKSPSPNDKLIRNLCTFATRGNPNIPNEEIDSKAEMISFAQLDEEQPPETPVLCKNTLLVLKTLASEQLQDLNVLKSYVSTCRTETDESETCSFYHILTQILPSCSEAAQSDLLSVHYPALSTCLKHPETTPRLRFMCCKALTQFCKQLPTVSMLQVFTDLDDFQTTSRIELVFHLVQELETRLVGYLPLCISPVMTHLSDSRDSVRAVASNCFSSLVKLFPLETRSDYPKNLSADLVSKRELAFDFIDGLSSPKPLDSITGLKGTLRSYQLEGVSWMSFLGKYGVNGILGDDMGLGKTLQVLCTLKLSAAQKCLIVCPKTLVYHWEQEAKRFFPDQLTVTLYDRRSPPTVAGSLEHLTIVSYNELKRNLEHFTPITWNYLILDEGHVVRNPKSVAFRAVKQVNAEHRLLLSGTPVQNNAAELWALFELLMPGYLGSKNTFNQRYVKPILAARKQNATELDAAKAQNALDSLHKQVLPFILRRRKTDVLSELPPKVVQDYHCDLSDVQQQLHDDYISQLYEAAQANSKRVSSFEILSYLRRLIDHPALVLSSFNRAGVDMIECSGKFSALRELLHECGLGESALDESADVTTIAQHRVLIFCQLKAVCDLLCELLAAGGFGAGISHLKLDGSVPAERRQTIVDQFNGDPSIDVLVLTTKVGGLGLNLTGADTVIFLDHDWNPAADLQAMDRAHRIGQTRTVNVYRLITRNTLEERVMRMQCFKRHMADTIIGADNTSVASMATGQLLDMLVADRAGEGKPVKRERTV